jgi:N-methylhydantoinase A
MHIAPDAGKDTLAQIGRKVSEVFKDLEARAVAEMIDDGHAKKAIRTAPFLMMRYTGQLEDVEVASPVARIGSAADMQKVLAAFEAVYEKINHRVSRYGQAGTSIMEIGITAIADKVKPTLEARPLGRSDPTSAHKGQREAYIGGRWHTCHLYEMDRLEPGHELIGPAIVEHPATTLIVHPGDRVTIDQWSLLHYRHA